MNQHQGVTILAHRNHHDININFKLGRAREGFIYRGKQLYNRLPIDLKTETRIFKFKKNVKTWITDNIPALPT